MPYSLFKGHKQRQECHKLKEGEKDYQDEEEDQAEVFQPNNLGASLIKSLYIFEKDSKFIYEYEV